MIDMALVEYLIFTGNITSFKRMIELNAYNINSEDRHNFLILASKYNQDEILEYIVERYEFFNINKRDEDGHSALYYATLNENENNMRRLYDAGSYFTDDEMQLIDDNAELQYIYDDILRNDIDIDSDIYSDSDIEEYINENFNINDAQRHPDETPCKFDDSGICEDYIDEEFEPTKNINPRYVIKLRINDQLKCFDVRALYHSINSGVHGVLSDAGKCLLSSSQKRRIFNMYKNL